MHPIEMRQVKEVILVSDDVHTSRRLYRDVLGLAMPATPDRLNLARVGSQYLGVSQAGVMTHPDSPADSTWAWRSPRPTSSAPSTTCGVRASTSRCGLSNLGTWTRPRASARTSSIPTRT